MIDLRAIAKLPKWAKEHIEDVERQRDAAVHQLNRFCDEQTPSAFYVEDHPCIGGKSGPSEKRHYLQTHKVAIEYKGVVLEIITRGDANGIVLQWGPPEPMMGEIAMIPTGFQSARLVSKGEMR